MLYAIVVLLLKCKTGLLRFNYCGVLHPTRGITSSRKMAAGNTGEQKVASSEYKGGCSDFSGVCFHQNEPQKDKCAGLEINKRLTRFRGSVVERNSRGNLTARLNIFEVN